MSDKQGFTVNRVNLIIGMIISLSVIAGSLIGCGVWITSVQRDIADLNLKVATVMADVERIRTEGTKLSQENRSNLLVFTTELSHIKTSLEKNDKDHEKIINSLEKLNSKNN